MAPSATHNKNEGRDLLGELFTALESDREGADVVYSLRLAKPVGDEALLRSLREFCEEYPDLRGPCHDPAEAAARIWLTEPPSDREAFALRLPLDSSPPVRLFRAGATELRMVIHHSLTDGHGSLRFLTQWLQRAAHLEAGIADGRDPGLRAPRKIGTSRFVSALLTLEFMIRRKVLASFRPPMMFGALMPGPVIRRSQVRRELSAEEFTRMREFLKKERPGASLNDWLVRSLIRALETYRREEEATGRKFEGGPERLSIYVPMDVRPWIGDPAYFWNASAGYQIDTSSDDRRDDAVLLKTVGRQRKNRATAARLLTTYRMAGFVLWMRRVFKLDLSVVTPESWRHTCAACFTNMGKFRELERMRDLVDGIFAAPLTMAPLGICCGVISVRDRLCFTLGYADYALNDRQAERLADLFLQEAKGVSDGR